MAEAAHADNRQSFVVEHQNKARARVRIRSRDPQYNREQAVKDLAEIDALIVEGKFKRLKTVKEEGVKPCLYRFILADGRRFRQRTETPFPACD